MPEVWVMGALWTGQTMPAGPPLPTWGWGTIVAALVTVCLALAHRLWKSWEDRAKAQDARIVAEKEAGEAVARAEKEKVELVQEVQDKTVDLLERAIEAFTINKTGTDQLVEKHTQVVQMLSEVRDEVRRVGEKVNNASSSNG